MGDKVQEVEPQTRTTPVVWGPFGEKVGKCSQKGGKRGWVRNQGDNATATEEKITKKGSETERRNK